MKRSSWAVWMAAECMVVALSLQACAGNAVSRRLDEKLASEPQVGHSADLSARAEKVIETTNGLTEQQRAKLRSIREWMRSSTREIDQESLRLRAVLVRDVISEKYDREEVDLIKSRMTKLEDKRLDLMFEAIRRVDVVMGRPDPNRKLNQHFMIYPAMVIYPW